MRGLGLNRYEATHDRTSDCSGDRVRTADSRRSGGTDGSGRTARKPGGGQPVHRGRADGGRQQARRRRQGRPSLACSVLGTHNARTREARKAAAKSPNGRRHRFRARAARPQRCRAAPRAAESAPPPHSPARRRSRRSVRAGVKRAEQVAAGELSSGSAWAKRSRRRPAPLRRASSRCCCSRSWPRSSGPWPTFSDRGDGSANRTVSAFEFPNGRFSAAPLAGGRPVARSAMAVPPVGRLRRGRPGVPAHGHLLCLRK